MNIKLIYRDKNIIQNTNDPPKRLKMKLLRVLSLTLNIEPPKIFPKSYKSAINSFQKQF